MARARSSPTDAGAPCRASVGARRIATALAVIVPPACAFDARLWPATCGVAVAAIALEIVLSLARDALAGVASVGLASLLCAHAAIHWMPFDLGASFGAAAAICVAHALASFGAHRRRLARAFVAASSSAALLALVELALPPAVSWIGADEREPHEQWSADLYQQDPELGWRANRAVTVVDTSFLASGEREWTATYHTDADGGRVVPGRPDAGPCILLFGCSYAFGHGLDDGDTIAAALQRALPAERVFDYGGLAYGGVQSEIAMRRCAQPSARCALYLCLDDHLRRDGGDETWLRQFPDAPRCDVDASGALVRRPASCFEIALHRVAGSLWKRSFWFRRFDALRTHALEEEGAIARAEAVVAAMRADVANQWGRDCRFAAVFLPEANALRMPARSRRVLERLRARGIECLDLFDAVPGRPTANDFDRSTGHPRADWARAIAGVLAARFGADGGRAH